MGLLAFLVCPALFGGIAFFASRNGNKEIPVGLILFLVALFFWNANRFDWSWDLEWLGPFFWGYCVALPGLLGAILGAVLGWRAYVYETNKALSKNR